MSKHIRKVLGLLQHRKQIPPPRQQPTSRTPEEWSIYWKAQGQPWRTEPEIDKKRQEYLAKRRLITPNIEQGIYPFKDVEPKLTRADIEWLLATLESSGMRGPVDWSDESQRYREGVDLQGANLQQADLSGLPLAGMSCGLRFEEWRLATEEQRSMAAVHLEEALLWRTQLQGANLERAQLQGANLMKAQLQEAYLVHAQLQGAKLSWAQLQGAFLLGAQLQGAFIEEAQLQGADLAWAQLQGAKLGGTQLQGAKLGEIQLQGAYLGDAQLQGADLRRAQLQGAYLMKAQLQGADLRETDLEHARLNQVTFSDQTYGSALLADISWGEVNLAVVDWGHVKKLGDEQVAYQKKDSEGKTKGKQRRVDEYNEAVRANRQLAVVLRDQGLNEEADHFSYHAQLLQRKVLWLQHEFGRWLFSMLLALLSGYGYRIWRILAAYIVMVSLFALAYFVLGIHYSPHLPLGQAYLESITAFHGRVFFEPFSPNTPQIWLTALEAIAGLIIEGVFIAMLIQRFFGK